MIRQRVYSQTFTALTETVATAPFECEEYQRIVVHISATEGDDGLTVTPEIQFNADVNAYKSWSTGATMNYWGTAATATAMDFDMAAITATGVAHANVPVMGVACRVNLVVSGTPGEFDVTVTIIGIG